MRIVATPPCICCILYILRSIKRDFRLLVLSDEQSMFVAKRPLLEGIFIVAYKASSWPNPVVRAYLFAGRWLMRAILVRTWTRSDKNNCTVRI